MAEILTTSFAYGEFAPEVYGRVDLPQYRAGAASMKNMIVLPNGSAMKRPGTLYLGAIAARTRLISMQVGAAESVVLALSAGSLKVLDDEGEELKAFTSQTWITANNLWQIQVVQSKYEMVFVGPTFAPQLLRVVPSDYSTSTLAALPSTPPSDATKAPVFATGTDNKRPRSVAYIDERLVYGGTNEEQNAIWGSELKGLFRYINDAGVTAVNFNSEGATTADQPFTFLILDSGYIDIQWMRTTSTIQEGILLVGTTAGVYAVIGMNESGALSPLSIISPRQQSTSGCSNVLPVVAGNFMVYVDSSKRTLRIVEFSLQGGQFQTPQINELATHLFESDVKELHFQRAPYQIIWVVLQNGTVLSFSFNIQGTLAAWTPMEFTGMTVDSMAVALGEEEDRLFFSMKEGENYMLLELAKMKQRVQSEMVFIDKAIIKENVTAFSTFDGLSIYNGDEIVIYADGAPHPNREVASGEVELNRDVNIAIGGRAYRCEITTLPIPEVITLVKRVHKVFVRFLNTLGAFAGDDEFEEIVPFRPGNFVMNEIPELFSGIKEIPYQGRHDRDARVTVYSDSPTPFHVLNLVVRLEAYR